MLGVRPVLGIGICMSEGRRWANTPTSRAVPHADGWPVLSPHPWPAPEVFGTLPGSRELLRAVADYDLVGVQTEQDADNLSGASLRNWRRSELRRGARGQRATHPGQELSIGIDVKGFRQAARAGRPQSHRGAGPGQPGHAKADHRGRPP